MAAMAEPQDATRQARLDQEEAEKLEIGTAAGLPSYKEYIKAQNRKGDEQRAERRGKTRKYNEDVMKSGPDVDREMRDNHERGQPEAEKQHRVWWKHLRKDFCPAQVKTPEGSMIGDTDYLDEQHELGRPHLEDMVLDEEIPSRRVDEDHRQWRWSRDPDYVPNALPIAFVGDTVLRQILALQFPSQAQHQTMPNLTGRPGTKQSLGKRSTEEREENGDMEDSNIGTRRVKARIDETEPKPHRHIPQVRGSSKRSRAIIPRETYANPLARAKAQDSSEAQAAAAPNRPSHSPLLGSTYGSARTVAPADPLKRLRGTYATDRLDEEARTRFPFAGTGVNAVGIAPSPHGLLNNNMGPLLGSGSSKRNRDTLSAEEDEVEERSPKKARGTLTQGDLQQHRPNNTHRPIPRVHARHTGYSGGVRKQPRAGQFAGTRVTEAHRPSPLADTVQPTVNKGSSRSQVLLSTNAPDPSPDVVGRVIEVVNAQITDSEAKNTHAHAQQAPEVLPNKGTRGLPIEQELRNDRRHIPRASPQKRGRGSETEEDGNDPAGASPCARKKLRRMEVSDRRTVLSTTRDAASASYPVAQKPIEAVATTSKNRVTALPTDGVAGGLTAATLQTDTVAEPPARVIKGSRGVKKGRAKKNPPAGVQSRARGGRPAKSSTQAKSKPATRTSRWLSSLLGNGRVTRSQKKQQVFIELDAQSVVVRVRR
ncbi:MAG: hypothetical protein Q9168_002708 [Polycauliona sp. 1 TL-2023]